jgi:hypothetical protein
LVQHSQQYKTAVKIRELIGRMWLCIWCYYSICLERLLETHIKSLTINCISIAREIRALLHMRKALPHFMS